MTDQSMRQERRMKFNNQELQQLEQLLNAALSPVNLQLQNGEKRMDGLAHDIGELSVKQTVNNVKTDMMFETFDTAKKGLVLLGTIGGGLKWVAGVVAAVVATWAAMKANKP